MLQLPIGYYCSRLVLTLDLQPLITQVPLGTKLADKLERAKTAVMTVTMARDKLGAYDKAVEIVSGFTQGSADCDQVVETMSRLLNKVEGRDTEQSIGDLVSAVCMGLDTIAQAKQRAAGPAEAATDLLSSGTYHAGGGSSGGGGGKPGVVAYPKVSRVVHVVFTVSS